GSDFSGSIALFYNEKKFYRKSFSLVDTRTYNGEESSAPSRLLGQIGSQNITNPDIAGGIAKSEIDPPGGNIMQASSTANDIFFDKSYNTSEARLLLQALKKEYMEQTILRFTNLPKNEERFVFLTLRALPEMIKDTNDIIKMTAILIPDNPSLQVEKYDLEIPVVVSHDPNEMVLNKGRINYRFMGKKKELTYKIQFQNFGNGPARNISIGIALPKQLNATSLQIKTTAPNLVLCDSVIYGQQSCLDTIRTADSIHIIYRNIYLPGTNQNLVRDEDSTKGFVEYGVRFKKKPKKIPFSSRAVIVFDNNKPIYTNKVTAKFIKGISPGIIAGYNLSLATGNYSAKGPLQIGYVLAPFAPSRPYFQAELHASIFEQEDSTGTIPYLQQVPFQVPQGVNIDTKNSYKETVLRRNRNWVQAVPIHFRYNINNWIGLGLGVMGQIAITEKSTLSEKYYVRGRIYNQMDYKLDTVLTQSSTKMWTSVNAAPFFDLQVGRVRTGPTLGLRYLRTLRGNIPNRFLIYAGFKL
ncbi:MAG TPA: hypothetical protein VF540_04280, partial [Segetibacter sp.]